MSKRTSEACNITRRWDASNEGRQVGRDAEQQCFPMVSNPLNYDVWRSWRDEQAAQGLKGKIPFTTMMQNFMDNWVDNSTRIKQTPLMRKLDSVVRQKLKEANLQLVNLQLYTSAGTPLDYEWGADAFFATEYGEVTIDFTLRNKNGGLNSWADIVLQLKIGEDGDITCDGEDGQDNLLTIHDISTKIVGIISNQKNKSFRRYEYYQLTQTQP